VGKIDSYRLCGEAKSSVMNFVSCNLRQSLVLSNPFTDNRSFHFLD